jgi:hypothetical protein
VKSGVRHFGRVHCVRLRGGIRKQSLLTCVSCCISTLKAEEMHSSDKSATFYQTTRPHVAEDSTLPIPLICT